MQEPEPESGNKENVHIVDFVNIPSHYKKYVK